MPGSFLTLRRSAMGRSKPARRIRRFFRVPLLVERLETRVVPSFVAPRAFDAESDPYSVALGDVNGDGRPDLAAANDDSGTVSVLLGNGVGSFQAARHFAIGTYPRSVALGDVNGDGRLDLAAANYLSFNVSVLLGNGDGSFGPARNFLAGSGPTSVVVGEFN